MEGAWLWTMQARYEIRRIRRGILCAGALNVLNHALVSIRLTTFVIIALLFYVMHRENNS